MMFNRNIIPIILFISSSVVSGYDFFITSQPGTFSEYFTSKNGVSCSLMGLSIYHVYE